MYTPQIPYGTYQRATRGYPVRSLNPRLIIILVRQKFAPSARRSRTLREVRHAYFRSAIATWKEELEMMNQFKM